MKFHSQICTTKEQSERLIALGLKKETADMKWLGCTDENGDIYYLLSDVPHHFRSTDIPAWSLHRLIEMMPTLIGWRDKQYWLDVNNDGVCYSTSMSYALVEFIADNLYDNIIFCIEWLIEEGYFNKEYLV